MRTITHLAVVCEAGVQQVIDLPRPVHRFESDRQP